MILEEKFLKPCELLLDSENPRYMEKLSSDQESILNYVISQKFTKELAKSMKVKLQWVNKIVVKPTDKKNRYIVVEGNTRTSIIKSGELDGYDNTTSSQKIPVLIAKQEDGESLSQYYSELRRIQGIANVLTVKEWDAASKARFIWEDYNGLLGSLSPTGARQTVSQATGIPMTQVAKSIRMYAFFKVISEMGDSLKEDDFSKMEGFNVNSNVRSFFGFNDITNEFDIGDDEDGILTEEQEVFRRRLEGASQFLKNISALEFRKKIKCVIDDSQNEEKYFKIVEGELDWSSNICEEEIVNPHSIQEQWEKSLETCYDKIQSIPIGFDWENSQQITDLLDKIASKSRLASGQIKLANEEE
jgi:hypothetical protein